MSENTKEALLYIAVGVIVGGWLLYLGHLGGLV